MPKKHKQVFHKPNANYGGSGSSSTQTKPPTTTLSVNERLSNLRLAQSSPASAERKRELAELSNQRSLPPNLGQGILGLPAGATPQPRNNETRARIRLRTPGPAPPLSWLSRPATQNNRYYPARRTTARYYGKKLGPERKRPDELARFMNMTGNNPVQPGSLVHMTLLTAAENWTDIVEDCADSLDVIPARLRAALLSYLTMVGPSEGLDMAGVKALFPSQSDVSCLDFSGFVGWGFSLKELKKWLNKTGEESSDLTHKSNNQENGILDSWDQETGSEGDDHDHIQDFTLSPTLDTKLQHLTKLSLGYPPSSISWTDLLSLSKDLHTITHLSLAYWPLPTRTPNMTATSYATKTGLQAPAGATNLYTSLDNDFEESALVLRQLAENTYCLRWLDLHGCTEWLGALTWRHPSFPFTTTTPNPSEHDANDWNSGKAPQGPNWNGSWRHLTYLNVSQSSPPPRNPKFLKSQGFRRKLAMHYFRPSPSQSQILDDVKEWLDIHPEERELQKNHCPDCHQQETSVCEKDCTFCNIYQDNQVARIARWVEREDEARNVARAINGARVGTGNKRCSFDHGWQQRQGYPITVFSRQ